MPFEHAAQASAWTHLLALRARVSRQPGGTIVVRRPTATPRHHMNHRAGCQPEDHAPIGRRELLRAGGLGLFGATLADLFRLEAQAGPAKRLGKAKAVVFIFQSGGPSQHETWDPKPDAPAEIRGEYGTIGTRLPGFRICEYLPKLAQRTDRFTVVRTIHHPAPPEFRNEHGACMYMLQT